MVKKKNAFNGSESDFIIAKKIAILESLPKKQFL